MPKSVNNATVPVIYKSVARALPTLVRLHLFDYLICLVPAQLDFSGICQYRSKRLFESANRSAHWRTRVSTGPRTLGPYLGMWVGIVSVAP